MASTTAPLLELFNEVHRFSSDLKKLSASTHGDGMVLIATQSLMQMLAEHGPQTVPSIAQARHNSRQNIQVMADRLAHLGWIEFIPNPKHKRSDLVQLTQKGLVQLKTSAEVERRILERLATNIPEQAIRKALDLLGPLHLQIVSALDGPIGTRTASDAAESSTSVITSSTRERNKMGSRFDTTVRDTEVERADREMTSVSAAASEVPRGAEQNVDDDQPLPLNLL